MTTVPPLLEVTVLHERDVPGAVDGGADRLHLVSHAAAPEDGPTSPEPATVSAVCRASEVPVFVLLRLNSSWTTTGGELTRLAGLAHDYLGAGAAGVSFGFLDVDLGIDTGVCAELARMLRGVPWTFHRGFDAALEPQRAWRDVAGLPGLVGVRSAGSLRGMDSGIEELLATVSADPVAARLLVAGGGLLAEHVPWLLRAGVGQFHLGRQTRPGATYRSYVDAAHVRSWRLLLDDAAERIR